ncbi:MAG: hypothetical protein JWO36_1254, partial [Myxococcales bacterium]|nr:hypothetical protein [Myxococcales bacterium]
MSVSRCRFAGGAFALMLLFAVTQTAYAQSAWVATPHSLTVDLAYQYVPSSAVVISPDLSVPDRDTRNHIVTLSADYVPIPKLALEFSLPMASVRYAGKFPHSPPGKWDDGNYHTALTDFRVGARYQVLDEPYLAISPHIAFSVPVMNYEVIGFATGGRHLKQAHFGASLGRTFAPYVPNLFITGSYEFTIAESYKANADTEKIGQSRSDLAFTLGYVFLDGKLNVNVGGNWRIAHGGVNFTDFANATLVPADVQL